MAGPKFLRGKTISLLIFFANYLNHFLCDCLVYKGVVNGTSNLPIGGQVAILNEIGKTIASIDVIGNGYLMTTPSFVLMEVCF